MNKRWVARSSRDAFLDRFRLFCLRGQEYANDRLRPEWTFNGLVRNEVRWSDGDDWVLSVTDNGVGLPGLEADCTAGLGTNIVAALAKSLDATVRTTDAAPGLAVSVTHS